MCCVDLGSYVNQSMEVIKQLNERCSSITHCNFRHMTVEEPRWRWMLLVQRSYCWREILFRLRSLWDPPNFFLRSARAFVSPATSKKGIFGTHMRTRSRNHWADCHTISRNAQTGFLLGVWLDRSCWEIEHFWARHDLTTQDVNFIEEENCLCVFE